MTSIPSWGALNPSDYITAEEFGGKDVTMTITSIERVDIEKEDGTVKKHGVVGFRGTDRRWVLNSTNVQLLKQLIDAIEGRETVPNDAIGHKVTLTSEDVRFGREKVKGIRVKGSPELTRNINATVKLPRRKATERTLYATGGGDGGETVEDAGGDDMHAVCMNCGHDALLAPDVSADDVPDMTCSECGEKGGYRLGTHEGHDPDEEVRP